MPRDPIAVSGLILAKASCKPGGATWAAGEGAGAPARQLATAQIAETQTAALRRRRTRHNHPLDGCPEETNERLAGLTDRYPGRPVAYQHPSCALQFSATISIWPQMWGCWAAMKLRKNGRQFGSGGIVLTDEGFAFEIGAGAQTIRLSVPSGKIRVSSAGENQWCGYWTRKAPGKWAWITKGSISVGVQPPRASRPCPLVLRSRCGGAPGVC